MPAVDSHDISYLIFLKIGNDVSAAVVIGPLRVKVKSGNFGHQENFDTHLQTVEIQITRLFRFSLFV